MIARAEADNRGVALVPLGEAGRDISLQTPAAARVRLNQIKPKPHAIERVDALPAHRAAARRHAQHGSHLAVRRRRSRPRLGIRRRAWRAAAEGRPVSVVTGGLPTAHALAAADNAAGALTVKVLRATTGGNRGRR